MGVAPGEANESKHKEPKCENCEHFEQRDCGLFLELNAQLPDRFEMETVVSKNGVCAAHQPMKESLKNLKRKGQLASDEEHEEKEKKLKEKY